MDDPIRAEKHAYQIRVSGAEQVARHVYDNDYSGGEFQVQVLLETDQDYHRHREDGEEQFIAYARFEAGYRDRRMKCREYVYNA